MKFRFTNICLGCFLASSALGQYTAEILLTPSGRGRAMAAGSGQIIGVALGSGGGPALWDGPGHNLIDLTTPGYTGVELNGVGGGVQVGYGVSNTTRALMWSGSPESVVDLHPVGFAGSVLEGTDGVQQVGTVSPNGFNSLAAVWSGSAASAVVLHPAGYENSLATDVFSGVQVGDVSGEKGGAVIWRGSSATMQFLPTPKNFTRGGAAGIYGNQVVGRITSFAAVVWDIDKWTYTSLGEGFALDTNGVFQVGIRTSQGLERAIRWTGTEASALDLHQFVPSNISESRAMGIDENGVIAGWGTIVGVGSVPIVWTPVPEPAAVSVLSLGALYVIIRKRRHPS